MATATETRTPKPETWDSPLAPDQRLRKGEGELLRFHRGFLTTGDPDEIALVRKAAQRAPARYLPAEEPFVDHPIVCRDCRINTFWHSQKAFDLHRSRFHQG